ncbi:uncharacterized protein FTJAE_1775 [Fusarium tjaetaba]|uniref:DUF3669 domain-containing protein n=1 Tax=Fusarium tjaetaba TaxID=1567544 RepID=A0A8H5W6S0_9HYPO|nr:uncharacterized protein FTJAE_1775 [Fusarium tjaetaba]KAF5647343.1 hypothetical protein FTJAE_1775 [Fusarium tjaetaba]
MASTQKRRLPHVVTLLTQEDNTTETQEGDSKYALSTEYDCDPRKLASYNGSSWCLASWCLPELWDAAEYQLTKIPCHDNSNIHKVQVGGIKYAAKLSDNPEAIKREVQNHMLVVEQMNLSWRRATRKFYDKHDDPALEISTGPRRRDKVKFNRRGTRYRGPKSPLIPDFVSDVIHHDHEGQDIATAGYVTSFIPTFQPATVRALIRTFVDSSIRESVKNDPNLSNVRFRVHLGLMAPPDEPLSTRLLSRPVYLDQLQHEAEQHLELWCERMGVSLAILHWKCNLDAAGVKFYLAPDKRGRTQLWMTDFGDCKPLQPGQDETKAMAEAVYNNTVWPRPPLKRDNLDGEKWRLKGCAYRSFIKAYAIASNRILSRDSPEYVERYPALISRELLVMNLGPIPIILNWIQDKRDERKKLSLKYWKEATWNRVSGVLDVSRRRVPSHCSSN